MKQIFDWRNWVLGILFSGGVCCTLFAFGDPKPDMSVTAWLSLMVMFLAIAALCFTGLYFCLKAWGDNY